MKISIGRKLTLKYIFITALMVVMFLIFGSSFGVLFIMANLFIVLMIMFSNNKYRVTGNPTSKLLGRLITAGYLVFLLSFTLIESFIIYESQTSKKANLEDIDFVIILGAGLNGDKPSKTLEDRLEAGLQYLMKNKNLPVIVSGGQGPGESITEAEAMGKFLLDNGISANRIYYENLSTTTYENINFSKNVIEELGGKDQTVLIVTSDYHILRAKMIGEDLGLHCDGLGADSPLFVKINYFIREYFAVVKTMAKQII
jgi:uncharacterized SAM-binding protein YcdF (DUF218 family)